MVKKSIKAATTFGLLFCLLAAGCAGLHKPAAETRAQAESPIVTQAESPIVTQAEPPIVTQAEPPIVTQDLPAPADPVAASPTPEAQVDSTVATVTPPELPAAKPKQAPPNGTAVSTPASRKSAAPGSEAQAQSTAKAAARPAQTPEKPVAAAPAVMEPQKKEAPAPAPAPAARATEPTLDVADLKSRLRDTKAIGAFTKIALSNQMDDLLKQFRAIYEGRQRTSVTSLRQPYDSLVVKVVTVLKDDPALARTISASREAIWGILSDPVKFKSVT